MASSGEFICHEYLYKKIFQIILDLFRQYFLVFSARCFRLRSEFRKLKLPRTLKTSRLDEKSLRFLFGSYFCPDTHQKMPFTWRSGAMSILPDTSLIMMEAKVARVSKAKTNNTHDDLTL
jgi:hypothetical protein